jgi:hypothetical protein
MRVAVIESFTDMLTALFNAGFSGGDAGASHSGEGERTTSTTTVGSVYGDYRAPMTVGSGGLKTRPGGALNVQADTVTINGKILAKSVSNTC